jgi:hypothetical protein
MEDEKTVVDLRSTAKEEGAVNPPRQKKSGGSGWTQSRVDALEKKVEKWTSRLAAEVGGDDEKEFAGVLKKLKADLRDGKKRLAATKKASRKKAKERAASAALRKAAARYIGEYLLDGLHDDARRDECSRIIDKVVQYETDELRRRGAKRGSSVLRAVRDLARQ